MLMKEYVNEKDQLEKVELFKTILSEDGIQTTFNIISLILHQNLELERNNALVEGKKIIDTEIYKTHYPLFEEIANKSIDKFDLLKIFGFKEKEILSIKNKDKDEAPKLALKLGIDINDKTKNLEEKGKEVLLKIAGKVTPEVNKGLNKGMSFSNDELNRILNGMDDYFKIWDKYKLIEDQDLKDYTSLKLYVDAFEVYLKVLKEAYSKIEKVKIEKINNKKMYKFLEEKYPLLLDSTNNKLRNDVCHLTYKERGKYTTAQIDDERKVIIIKAITGILTKEAFIVGFFDKSIKVDEIEKNVLDEISEVDNSNKEE